MYLLRFNPEIRRDHSWWHWTATVPSQHGTMESTRAAEFFSGLARLRSLTLHRWIGRIDAEFVVTCIHELLLTEK